MNDRPHRVLHIISNLGIGGAERMLQKLIEASETQCFEHSVTCLTQRGPVGDALERAGVKVDYLGMRRSSPNPSALFRLARKIRRTQPAVIQTWMYHADLLGSIAARLARSPAPVIWNIRQSLIANRSLRLRTRGVMRLTASLSSRLPTRIICCAEAAKESHLRIGYDASKIVVIPNGFDIHKFRPNPSARVALRAELDLPIDARVILSVGRFAQEKDYPTMMKAISKLDLRHLNAYVVLCGDGLLMDNPRMRTLVSAHSLERFLHLLGPRDDIPFLMAGADVFMLTSLAEGFPNVVGEAMSAGTPCIVTDAGDARRIVGQRGIVVRCGDAAAIADGLTELLSLSDDARLALANKARRRIIERYSLSVATRRYEELYQEVIQTWAG